MFDLAPGPSPRPPPSPPPTPPTPKPAVHAAAPTPVTVRAPSPAPSPAPTDAPVAATVAPTATVSAAPANDVNAAPTTTASPDTRATSFQSVDNEPEAHSGEGLLVSAYSILWVILIAWLVIVWRKQAGLNARLEGLERAIDRAVANAEKASAAVVVAKKTSEA